MEEPTAEPPGEDVFKTATFIFPQDFDNLNPLYTQSWFSTVTQQLWNCWPWVFDEGNNPIPVLLKEMPSAANGGISPDGKVITMYLRDDLVWSDGEPLTSEDFVFTYEMARSDQNLVATRYPYNQVASVQAPDDHTVVVSFQQPFAPWMATLWQGLLPAHILDPVFHTSEFSKKILSIAEMLATPAVSYHNRRPYECATSFKKVKQEKNAPIIDSFTEHRARLAHLKDKLPVVKRSCPNHLKVQMNKMKHKSQQSTPLCRN